MEEKDKEDPMYYKELQSAARSYNIKIWAIPGLFGALIAFIVVNLKFPELINFRTENIFLKLENTIILFFGSLFTYALILHFYKAHFYHLSIQKKIDRFDNIFNKTQTDDLKRIPLESTPDKNLEHRLKELYYDERNKCYFTSVQKWLVKQQVSPLVKVVMWLALIAVLLAFAFSLISLLSTSISLFL